MVKIPNHTSPQIFIKGVIYFIDVVSQFELIRSEYFYNRFEPNGYSLCLDELGIEIERELHDIDLGIIPKEGECYSFLWSVYVPSL